MHRAAMRKAIRNIMVIVDEGDKGLLKTLEAALTFMRVLAEEFPYQVVYPKRTCNETTCFVIFYSIKIKTAFIGPFSVKWALKNK
jgi:hypothetical protein